MANIGGSPLAPIVDNGIFEFRLAPATATPVPTSDTTTTTIYLCQYKGNRMSLFDSANWKPFSSAELSLALGTLVPYQAYDAFVDYNNGSPQLVKVEWANATVTMTIATPGVVTWTGHGLSTGDSITFTTSGALPTGVTANTQYFVNVTGANTFNLCTTRANVASATFVATSGSQSGTHTGHQPQARQTALTLQDGVQVLTGTTTYRYVGTILASSTTQTKMTFGGQDTPPFLGMWNYYNQRHLKFRVYDSTATWNYSTATWRQANAAATNQMEIVCGVQETLLDINVLGSIAGGSSAAGASGVQRNLTNSVHADCIYEGALTTVATAPYTTAAMLKVNPPVGYGAYLQIETGTGTATSTWRGLTADQRKAGMTGWWEC